MNGGGPVVGGNQVTPGDTRPVIPGSQPAGVNAAAASNSSTDLTIPHNSPAPATPTPMAPAAPSAPAADAEFSSLHSEPVSSPTPPAVPTPSSPTSTASPVNPLASVPATPPQPSSPLGAGMPAPMPGTSMQNTFTQTPLTQNGFTQNPFSGGVYSPNVYGQGEDIVIGGSTGAKPPKSKAKVILAVLAILIVLAGVAWAVVSSFGGLTGNTEGNEGGEQKVLTSKQEIYDTLWNFNMWHYSDTILYYEDVVGLTPNFTSTDGAIMFPQGDWIESFSDRLNNTAQAYEEIAPTIPDYLQEDKIDLISIKTQIIQSIEAMQQNTSIIKDFYETYCLPLTKEPVPATCTKTDHMLELEQDTVTATAAKAYHSLYCDAVDLLKTSPSIMELYEGLSEPKMTAAAQLNDLLTEVPSASNALKTLFEELTQ